MSFAEIVLRLGVAFVGWIAIYLHMIALLVVRIASCPGGDKAPWLMSTTTAILVTGAAFVLIYGHRLKGTASTLRYLVLPLLLLVPFGLWVLLPYLTGTTLGGLGVCEVALGREQGTVPTDWERAWAPLQLVALAAIAVNGWRLWFLDVGNTRK